MEPVAEFDDSEFSELDMEVIAYVIGHYGKMTASALVKVTHQEGSLWSQVVKSKNVRFTANNCTSEEEINFADLLDDGIKKTVYFGTLENMSLESEIN